MLTYRKLERDEKGKLVDPARMVKIEKVSLSTNSIYDAHPNATNNCYSELALSAEQSGGDGDLREEFM